MKTDSQDLEAGIALTDPNRNRLPVSFAQLVFSENGYYVGCHL